MGSIITSHLCVRWAAIEYRRKGRGCRRMVRARFHHYAWGLLIYVLAVILGGAFVRASISGDGCGSHWPDCNGQMIPDLAHAGAWAKTLTEWSHRASSGILVALILILVTWAFWAHP